jgi:hypothetical protein
LKLDWRRRDFDMKGFESWRGDLSEVIGRMLEVAIGHRPIKLLVLNDRIAFGLPRDGKMAGEVLKLYRPMRPKARLVAAGLSGAARCGLHGLVGRKIEGTGPCEISWLRDSGELGFLGCNPSHGIRAVILSRDHERGLKVTKLAIGGRHGSLRDEAQKLDQFSEQHGGISSLGGLEEGPDWTAFWTKFYAKPGPRKMRGEVVPLLEKWRSDEVVRLGSVDWLARAIEGVPESMGGKLRELILRRALVHGDFAPWNLRWDEEDLVAVDWEWGCEDGVAGLDLGHGLVAEAHLVEGLSGEKLIERVLGQASEPRILKHLRESGWEDLRLWLFFILLLHRSKWQSRMEQELQFLG